jgi:hypothetical protein
MKISKEILEIARDSRKIEELSKLNSMPITTHHVYGGRSRAKTGISQAGLVYANGETPTIKRIDDTIVWNSDVNCPVFSSDNFIIRCLSYSESNKLNSQSEELPRWLIMKNANG